MKPIDRIQGLPVAFDLTDDPAPRAAKGKFRLHKNRVVRRPSIFVNGIVLHQTAIEYGVSNKQLAAAEGDRELALARRAKGIACHACSFDGFYAMTYPLSWYIHHANSFNKNTLGLEIEGRYPGLLDDPLTVRREDLKTLWKGEATEFTPARLEAAKAALRHLVVEGRRLGMPLRYLYAHRQAKSNRRSDPGEELWQKLAVEYGVSVLGLVVRPSYTLGSGRPIPTNWDNRGIGDY